MRCGVEVAPLRAEPRDDAEQVTQALRGEPLQVEERRDGWARVLTSYDYPGWIREDVLCGDKPLEVARTFLGTPYQWGGMTAAGIDCSGLVHMAYRLCGIAVPRDADQQEAAGRDAELERGALISYGAPADHVAFSVGDGVILHSTGRDRGLGVVEEAESEELYLRRSRTFHL